jgi:hypothetical protein
MSGAGGWAARRGYLNELFESVWTALDDADAAASSDGIRGVNGDLKNIIFASTGPFGRTQRWWLRHLRLPSLMTRRRRLAATLGLTRILTATVTTVAVPAAPTRTFAADLAWLPLPGHRSIWHQAPGAYSTGISTATIAPGDQYTVEATLMNAGCSAGLRRRRRAECACGAVLCVRPEEGCQVFDGDRGLR